MHAIGADARTQPGRTRPRRTHAARTHAQARRVDDAHGLDAHGPDARTGEARGRRTLSAPRGGDTLATEGRWEATAVPERQGQRRGNDETPPRNAARRPLTSDVDSDALAAPAPAGDGRGRGLRLGGDGGRSQ